MLVTNCLKSLAMVKALAIAVMAGPKIHFFQDVMVFTCQNFLYQGLTFTFFALRQGIVELNNRPNALCQRIMAKTLIISQKVFSRFVVFNSSRRALKCCQGVTSEKISTKIFFKTYCLIRIFYILQYPVPTLSRFHVYNEKSPI